MKQSKNKIDCTPAKHEEGVAKCLIQMCKDSNAAITFFSMDCEDGYEVTISARQTEDNQKFQDIIDVCESNIADAKENEQEQENLDDEEEQN